MLIYNIHRYILGKVYTITCNSILLVSTGMDVSVLSYKTVKRIRNFIKSGYVYNCCGVCLQYY